MEIDGRGEPAVTRLVHLRFSAEGLRAEAATVLMDLIQGGHSAAEISEALEYAAPRLNDLTREIRAVAAEAGIHLPEPDE